MLNVLPYVLIGLAIAALAGLARSRYVSFWAQRPDDYAGDDVTFDIRERLNGPIVCDGVIFGPLGRVSSRFTANFDASWDGNRGVMKEHFIYDGGTTQDREWRLTLLDNGQIRAEADDLVEPGSGHQKGGAVQLNYKIRLPESSGGHVLTTTDWMYLTPSGAIMNRSQFRKFGITVAELVATMRPRDAA